MRKALYTFYAVIIGVAVVALATRPAPVSDQPVSFRPYSLGRQVSKDGRVGFRVRVSFELALTPTPEPLIFEYRPGRPAERVQPTHRIHFARDPGDIRHALTIVGTVRAFEPDTLIRFNGLHGVTVVDSAEVQRAAD